MILTMSILFGIFATITHFYFYRYKARVRKNALLKNRWVSTPGDVAELVFLIPYMTAVDRKTIGVNIDWFKVTSSYRKKDRDSLSIDQLPHTKGKITNAVRDWKLRRFSLCLVVFTLSSLVTYIAVNITLAL